MENGVKLPQYDNVYGEYPSKFKLNPLRTVFFIDTDREREIDIGEDYEYPAIPFG